MLDHYQQTKNLLVSYDTKPLGFFWWCSRTAGARSSTPVRQPLTCEAKTPQAKKEEETWPCAHTCTAATRAGVYPIAADSLPGIAIATPVPGDAPL